MTFRNVTAGYCVTPGFPSVKKLLFLSLVSLSFTFLVRIYRHNSARKYRILTEMNAFKVFHVLHQLLALEG